MREDVRRLPRVCDAILNSRTRPHQGVESISKTRPQQSSSSVFFCNFRCRRLPHAPTPCFLQQFVAARRAQRLERARSGSGHLSFFFSNSSRSSWNPTGKRDERSSPHGGSAPQTASVLEVRGVERAECPGSDGHLPFFFVASSWCRFADKKHPRSVSKILPAPPVNGVDMERERVRRRSTSQSRYSYSLSKGYGAAENSGGRNLCAPTARRHGEACTHVPQ